jgi:hypothetical protein
VAAERHALATSVPEKVLPVCIGQGAGWTLEPAGRFGGEKDVLLVPNPVRRKHCADRSNWLIVVMLLTAVTRRYRNLLISCINISEVIVKLNALISVNPTPFTNCTASRVPSLGRHVLLSSLFKREVLFSKYILAKFVFTLLVEYTTR